MELKWYLPSADVSVNLLMHAVPLVLALALLFVVGLALTTRRRVPYFEPLAFLAVASNMMVPLLNGVEVQICSLDSNAVGCVTHLMAVSLLHGIMGLTLAIVTIFSWRASRATS